MSLAFDYRGRDGAGKLVKGRLDASSEGAVVQRLRGMGVSPLPHTQPYFVAQVTLPSPSPAETPDEQSMSEDHLSPEDFPTAATQPAQASTFLQPPEYVTPASSAADHR